MDRKQQVIEATIALVAELGFHGASMAKIAKRSQTSAGILYHYFANRDDLLVNCYVTVKQRVFDVVLQDMPNELSLATFHTMWCRYYNYLRTHPHHSLFIEQYENSPYATAENVVTVMESDATLASLLHRFQAEVLAPHLPLDLAFHLSFGTAMRAAKHEVPLTEQQLETTITACWHAITREGYER